MSEQDTSSGPFPERRATLWFRGGTSPHNGAAGQPSTWGMGLDVLVSVEEEKGLFKDDWINLLTVDGSRVWLLAEEIFMIQFADERAERRS